MIYKFRAEALIDITTFLIFCYNNNIFFNKIIIKSKSDYEVTLNTNSELLEIRNIMFKVQDGHVMYQTLRLKKDYDGERDWDINFLS